MLLVNRSLSRQSTIASIAGEMGASPESQAPTATDDGGALGDSSSWPPGFRFHPTDEELVLYYLKRKVCRRRIRLPMIGDLDVYKCEPWELPERSVLRSGDKQWYFFSPRDRKYPNGSRSNRTTRCGYWKATGKDRTISHNCRPAGYKKTLVYHQGRAPKGQRTDWVMYEYTLDDQALLNCSNLQDYYALYKVFRKSGPGPKNGEQYGAPFREEEWNDDGKEADDGSRTRDIGVETVTDHLHSASAVTVVCENGGALLDGELENLLLQMMSEEDVMVPRQSQFPTYAPEVDIESELRSHIVGPSYADSSITKQTGGWCEQDSIGTNIHIQQSASEYAQPIETPEVTSLNVCYELGHALPDEEFLEIEDFSDPDPSVWSMHNINSDIHDTNEFYDPYDYFDPAIVLAETTGSLDATAYLDGFHEDGIQNQEAHLTSALWSHEQSFNVSAPMETKQILMPSPASGVVCNNSLSSLGGDTQGQINHAGSESESLFNLALSALLDSIPSPPAIASENALIARALERVSSFKTGQTSAQGQNSTTVGGAVIRRRQGGHNGGFLFIAFLVGLGAIFWVLTIGVVLKIIKSLWGRFVTS